MYTPLIGRRLLDRANARSGRQQTPAEFFEETFFRLVFDDDEYLMPAGNSKFGQLVNNRRANQARAEREGRPWDDAERARLRREALADFHDAAAEATEPQAHLVLGGYARGSGGITSGQVTAIDHRADADDVYLSWIGAAAGARVGDVVLLIDHDKVFDAVLDGWSLYRQVLRQTPGLRANQLETWNGQWLRHRFSARFDESAPTAFVQSVINTKKAASEITTVPWARLLLSLGRAFGDEPVSAYVYNAVGQANTTLGFIPLHLGATGALRESYATLRDFYRALFGEAVEAVGENHLDEVYDAAFGFRRACEQGAIGLRAFEPSKLYDFLPDGGKNRQPRPVGPADAQTPLLYQTWILAMLGDQKHDLYTLAHEAAERLLAFETGAIGGRTNLKKLVKEALGASSLEAFIAGLTQIAEDVQDASRADLSDEEVADTLAALDDLVRASISRSYEQFRLFLTLLRFQVALLRGRAAYAASSN